MAGPTQEELRTMLLWGAVGGMLPTLSKIAGTFGANFDAPTPKLFGVCAALVLYGLIGAVVSRAMSNPDMKQSLFAGIAAPAIVVGIIAGATDSNSTNKPAEKKQGLQFIGSAHAQAPAQRSPELNQLSLYVTVRGEVTINDTIKVSAVLANGSTNVLKNIELPKDIGNEEDDLLIEVPMSATTVIFTSSTGAEARTPVKSTHELIVLTITPKTSVRQDLVWALGGKRAFEIGRMRAKASVGK